MKLKYQIQTTAVAVTVVLALATTLAQAQFWGAPTGGWGYIYNGEFAAGSGGNAFDSLDGTWNHSSASLYGVGPGDSDNWDGSGIGTGAGAPGGVEGGTAGSTSYLRIQDAGNSSAFINPNNSSIAFGHNLTANGFSDTFMNSGVTLAFRIRVPTGALDARTSAASGTSPYPTTVGDGYGTFGNGLGELYVKNNANSVSGGARVGAIGFSLGSASENWPTSGGNTGFPNNTNGGAFLYMQNLTADVLNNQSDTGEAPATGQNVANRLAVDDPTQWNEFWINIVANDATPGNGTHTVRIWKNGELTYTDFNVTAGNNNQDYQAMASMGMALALTDGSGALDVDYFAVAQGLFSPTPVPEPSTLGLGVLGLLAMAASSRRNRRN